MSRKPASPDEEPAEADSLANVRSESRAARRAVGQLQLEILLDGITESNLHPETDWGPPVGKEIW